jgi:hypothetical protein
MKKQIFILFTIAGLLLITSVTYHGCRSTRIPVEFPVDTLVTNEDGKGDLLEIVFRRGTEHNHPLMAVWIEDTAGNYIQTLYVAESIAKGIFGYGDKTTGKWMPGPIRRPAALPVWAHSRGVKEDDGLYLPTEKTPVPDAYTGPTPQAHFVLLARTDENVPEAFYVFFEINQTWDWNEFWSNNKYPDDEEYKTSCQPALVYKTYIKKGETKTPRELELIGHSHFNGEDGNIYGDLTSITTAREISKLIYVSLLD